MIYCDYYDELIAYYDCYDYSCFVVPWYNLCAKWFFSFLLIRRLHKCDDFNCDYCICEFYQWSTNGDPMETGHMETSWNENVHELDMSSCSMSDLLD